jgi:hypothetical protein
LSNYEKRTSKKSKQLIAEATNIMACMYNKTY